MSQSSKRKIELPITDLPKLPKLANEKEYSLEDYAKKILNEVKKSRKDSKKSLRKQLRKFRIDFEDSQTTGINPLHLFPVEIWELILNSVVDGNILINCRKVCPLFQTIIKSTNQEMLFGKVIPFVFPYFEGQGRRNVVPQTPMEILVACGRVCKKWRAGVNRFANSYFCTEKFISAGLGRIIEEPTKHFENKEMLHQKDFYDNLPLSNEEKQELIESGERPVDFSDSDSDEEDPDIDRRWYWTNREYMRHKRKQLKLGHFPFLTEKSIQSSASTSKLASLEVYGRLLWHVRLEVGYNDHEYVGMQQFCDVYKKVLESCPNLRTLELSRFASTNVIKPTESDDGIVEQLGFLTHQNLESLVVLERSNDILPIQLGILNGLSFTLEHVQVHQWNNQMACVEDNLKM